MVTIVLKENVYIYDSHNDGNDAVFVFVISCCDWCKAAVAPHRCACEGGKPGDLSLRRKERRKVADVIMILT